MAQTSRSADLTSGPMLQKIILFSIPLAASSILQLLFNAADVVVVGRFAGSTALAAVGSNGSLINLLVNLFVGLSLGANVVAARCFGAKDDRGVQDTVQTSVTLGLGYSVLPMVVSLVGSCLLRLVWIATIFQLNRTPFMLYISYPISWVLTAAVHLACLLVVRHKMKNRLKLSID